MTGLLIQNHILMYDEHPRENVTKHHRERHMGFIIDHTSMTVM